MIPTLYLSNWASRNSPGMWGPGGQYTIMLKPRPQYGELGQGAVKALVPTGDLSTLLDAALKERRDQGVGEHLAIYRAAFEARLRTLSECLGDRENPGVGLGPGCLQVYRLPVDGVTLHDLVGDGDTLCCACSRAEAAAGRCHRAWAAPFLKRAGWRVILDGVDISKKTLFSGGA